MSMNKLLFTLMSLVFISITSCKKNDAKPDDEEEKPTETEWPGSDYVIPDYADDYSPIASWDNRQQWNLANIHDPSIVYDGEYYYMYGTDASYGNVYEGKGHFPYRRSKNLVHWEFRGMAMVNTPAWVLDTLNHMRATNNLVLIDEPIYRYWAPVVRKVGSKYRMYYSIVVDNYIATGKPNSYENFDGSWTEHAFIGMMETSSLKNNLWLDKGMVIHSVSDKGTNWLRSSTADWNAYFLYNAIDPTYQETPDGKQYLIYGSWHSGIVSVQIDPITGKPFQLETLADYGTRIARRVNNDNNRWQGQEGPEILYNEQTGYYYLFLAYDELSVAYNTRVCRSTNINGPYFGIDGANVSQGANCYPMITHPYAFSNHSGWVGFSHNAVVKNEDTGDWFYCSQARLPENTNGNASSNAIMMGHVRKIRWTEEGWPVVMPERYTAVPEKEISEDELVGSWEHITLNYQFKTQQTSVALTLSSDHKATGAIAGNWSFDAENNTLTIGSTKLCIEREVDWEANPRKLTIVYAGLSANGKVLWGKKVE